MKKFFKTGIGIALCIALIFCLPSCRVSKSNGDDYMKGYDDGYLDGISMNSEEEFMKYMCGYEEAYDDFVEGVINNKAISYAREESAWHPEEALCIIDWYEKGYSYCGNYPITENDYKEAVKSLYRYYEYFYNARYEDDVECDYD